MNDTPVRISNELEDFTAGGLYPGGTGRVLEFKYRLWDYEGKQPPDSAVAVYCKLQPSDGSNNNEPVEIFWSVGPATDFGIDFTEGNLLSKGARTSLGGSSNWAFVQQSFRKSCGLEKGALSGEKGIRVLEGTLLTVSRVPQPKRDGLDDGPPPAEGQKARTRDILVPTRAVFPWEKGGAGAARPVAQMPSPAQTQTQSPAPAQSQPQSIPATNGASPAAHDGAANTLSLALSAAVSRHRTVQVAELGKVLLDEMVGVDRSLRMAIVKEAKDPAAIEELALVNNWKYDGATISAA